MLHRMGVESGQENFLLPAAGSRIRMSRRRGYSGNFRAKGTARSNEQIRYLLEHGQTGIDVIGDAPTQSLLDPDHPLAREAVGTQGVSLCRKQDFFDLFSGVPFDRVSISSSAPGSSLCRGWFWRPVKRAFHSIGCAARFSTVRFIRRIAPTHGIFRWSFACVLRSIPSSIVRSTCRSFTPISRTPISSANAA